MVSIKFKGPSSALGPGFIRRTSFEVYPSWDELSATASSLYDIDVKNLGLTYVDSDGDDILVLTDKELEECYSLLRAQSATESITLTVVDFAMERGFRSLNLPFSSGQSPPDGGSLEPLVQSRITFPFHDPGAMPLSSSSSSLNPESLNLAERLSCIPTDVASLSSQSGTTLEQTFPWQPALNPPSTSSSEGDYGLPPYTEIDVLSISQSAPTSSARTTPPPTLAPSRPFSLPPIILQPHSVVERSEDTDYEDTVRSAVALLVMQASDSGTQVNNDQWGRDPSVDEGSDADLKGDSVSAGVSYGTSDVVDVKKSDVQLFQCGICMEYQDLSAVASPESCYHEFCRYAALYYPVIKSTNILEKSRSCMRQYLRTTIRERRYPIICPVCVAEASQSDPTSCTYALIFYILVGSNCLVSHHALVHRKYRIESKRLRAIREARACAILCRDRMQGVSLTQDSSSRLCLF